MYNQSNAPEMMNITTNIRLSFMGRAGFKRVLFIQLLIKYFPKALPAKVAPSVTGQFKLLEEYSQGRGLQSQTCI